ncbi:hypothetical protein, partial [Pararcticibacter amylolyticus]
NDLRQQGGDGAAWPVVHKGKDLLEKMGRLHGKKKKPEKQRQEASSGPPGGEGSGLTGKRMKLNL